MAFIDSIFDFLIPILILWGAAKGFSKNNEEGEPSSPEVDEQARKIREEIQRKIHQRRAANAKAVGEVNDEPAANTQAIPQANPTATKVNVSEVEPENSVTDWKALELEVAKQNQQVEALKKRVSKQSVAKIKPVGTSEKSVCQTSPIYQQLQDPAQVRRAFVMQEILGTPIALRQNNKIGPLWGT